MAKTNEIDKTRTETPSAKPVDKKPARPVFVPGKTTCTKPGCGGKFFVRSTQSRKLADDRISVTRYVKCGRCAYKREFVEVVQLKKPMP